MSQRAYVKFQLKNYYKHKLLKHTFLRTPKGARCFNLMRHHGASIENTYCYLSLSILTHSMGNIRLH